MKQFPKNFALVGVAILFLFSFVSCRSLFSGSETGDGQKYVHDEGAVHAHVNEQWRKFKELTAEHASLKEMFISSKKSWEEALRKTLDQKYGLAMENEHLRLELAKVPKAGKQYIGKTPKGMGELKAKLEDAESKVTEFRLALEAQAADLAAEKQKSAAETEKATAFEKAKNEEEKAFQVALAERDKKEARDHRLHRYSTEFLVLLALFLGLLLWKKSRS